MNTAIEQMLRPYVIKNIHDQKNAMKEIIQEIVLCGLSRAEFFRDAAFYGGTALRIFHGLERFSEDLDFSLKVPNPTFSLEKYFPVLEKEIRAFGLNLRIEERRKTTQSHIRSAFLKGNTREHLLLFCEIYLPVTKRMFLDKKTAVRQKRAAVFSYVQGIIFLLQIFPMLRRNLRPVRPRPCIRRFHRR